MPKQTHQDDQEPDLEGLALFAPEPSLPAVKLTDVLKEYNLLAPMVPAKQLDGTTFIIVNAKPFESSFKNQEHAYFCKCKDILTGELFSTVLGGAAVVEVIDMLVNLQLQQQLEVTLHYEAGKGKYGGYYRLE